MGFYFGEQDNRKKEFVAVRMESQLFRALKTEANQKGVDLSEIIREKCRANGSNTILSRDTLPY